MRPNDNPLDDRSGRAREREAESRAELPQELSESDPTPAVGGLGGAAIGAAAGALAGPIGIGIGAVAGAVGGWWAGHAIHRAAQDYHREDESFRERHTELGTEHPEYDAARPAYMLGYIAGRNPEYRTKTFEEIEEHVRLGWTPDMAAQHGDWPRVRPYAEHAYTVGQSREPVEHDRAVPLTSAGSVADRKDVSEPPRPDRSSDVSREPDTSIRASVEEGEVVYPTEIDALANGIPAEPGSAAAREYGIETEDIDRPERERE